jgi:hypothetical protein
MHVLDSAWETLKREFESASQEKQIKARRQVTGELNRIFRRLRQYQSEEEWIGALRDGAALAARDFAIFTVGSGAARLRAQQGFALEQPLEIFLASANAFRSAVEACEPLVSLRRASEVGAALASGDPAARVHLFPISNSGRVVALVAAGDPELDADGLELVAGMASTVLERRANESIHTQIAPAKAPAQPFSGKAVRPLPSWAELSENDRRLHARAQRFARVAVAQMQLDRPEACRAGLEQSNLYMFLKPEIDKARENYAGQFMTIPSMVDYLHLELLNTMAEGDEQKLGAEYPGHLV